MVAEQERLSDGELSEWIDGLDQFDVDSDTTEIAGVRVSVSEDSSTHSSDVSMSMSVLDYGLELFREGSKEISYDRWVDTNWGKWQRANCCPEERL